MIVIILINIFIFFLYFFYIFLYFFYIMFFYVMFLCIFQNINVIMKIKKNKNNQYGNPTINLIIQ